jgi:hypothetical protein
MDERPVELSILKNFSPLDGLKAETSAPAACCSSKATPTSEPFIWSRGASSFGRMIG